MITLRQVNNRDASADGRRTQTSFGDRSPAYLSLGTLRTLKTCMTLALAPGLNLSSPAQSNGQTESCGESTGSIVDEFDYEDRKTTSRRSTVI
jgi:hypothetical protein